jgi:predicted ester cyclase
MNRIAITTAIAVAATACAITTNSAAADELPQPHHLAAGPLSGKVVTAARRYAAFWDTGDASYAQAALSPDFIDRTLPAGRPQGPSGPLAASQAFRKAVPDLRAEIDEMVVAGDRVSVHLHFHGHFSGQFGTVQGQGQPIDFQAFDLYRVEDGRIAENWHLEDNLSLMQQFGVIAR